MASDGDATLHFLVKARQGPARDCGQPAGAGKSCQVRSSWALMRRIPCLSSDVPSRRKTSRNTVSDCALRRSCRLQSAALPVTDIVDGGTTSRRHECRARTVVSGILAAADPRPILPFGSTCSATSVVDLRPRVDYLGRERDSRHSGVVALSAGRPAGRQARRGCEGRDERRSDDGPQVEVDIRRIRFLRST